MICTYKRFFTFEYFIIRAWQAWISLALILNAQLSPNGTIPRTRRQRTRAPLYWRPAAPIKITRVHCRETKWRLLLIRRKAKITPVSLPSDFSIVIPVNYVHNFPRNWRPFHRAFFPLSRFITMSSIYHERIVCRKKDHYAMITSNLLT